MSRDERRRRIRVALRECMLERGYANTSLADVARAADMSPSHLLYYFKNKDAILGYSHELSAARIMADVGAMETLPAEKRLDALAEYFFAEHGLGKSEMGLMLEVFGIAVHHKELHRQKARFDSDFKGWLRELFVGLDLQDAPERAGQALTAEAAAEEAYAVLVGLCTSAYFDERLDLNRARGLARDALRRLAGLAFERPPE